MNESVAVLRSGAVSTEEEQKTGQAILARILEQAKAEPASSATKYGITSAQNAHAGGSVGKPVPPGVIRGVDIGAIRYVGIKTLELSYEMIVPADAEQMIHGVAVVTGPGRIQDPERLSRNDLKRLARDDAKLLIAFASSGQMRPAQLAFAAELLGEVTEQKRAERALLSLASHDSSIVREGAINGLSKIGSAAAWDQIRLIAKEDRSPGVREAASEAMEEAPEAGG
jgi:hypothetical protein